MLVRGNYLLKRDVVYVTEDYNLENTLEVLNKCGYRCIPVLDKSEVRYLGNIYKTDIYEKMKDSSIKIPVTALIKDADEFVREESSFFEIFFSIKRLPFLAVNDENNKFQGILTHGKIIELLEDSWGTNSGSYTLTIGTIDYPGALMKVIKIINKYTSIQSLITLDNESVFLRRIVVTLPKDVDELKLKEIVEKLDTIGFRVVHVEKRN